MVPGWVPFKIVSICCMRIVNWQDFAYKGCNCTDFTCGSVIHSSLSINRNDFLCRLKQDTRLIKQRSEQWFEERSPFKLTGSTLFAGLGLDSLKNLQKHFDSKRKWVAAVTTYSNFLQKHIIHLKKSLQYRFSLIHYRLHTTYGINKAWFTPVFSHMYINSRIIQKKFFLTFCLSTEKK
jgi:hypothetical protein